MDMRLPASEHTSRPWRIHAIAPEFRLEDVWALPTPGGRDELRLLVEGFAAADPAQSPSRAARTLFSLRWKLGELLGLDDPDPGSGSGRQPSATGCPMTCAPRRGRGSRSSPLPRCT